MNQKFQANYLINKIVGIQENGLAKYLFPHFALLTFSYVLMDAILSDVTPPSSPLQMI